ncbi:hypothetical protein BD413DRAFT_489535 [Trametes elegans]|nr:hypothetical protein BD413DRAFT_489535 [Trametes elegans]
MLVPFAVLALSVSSVYGHAFIDSVKGANGVTGVGLGVTFNGEVARGGTGEQPFQLDTPVLKDTATDPCGATLLAGSVDIAKSMAAVSQAFGGLPTIPADGSLTMGVFQVNADGGGPFTAEINTDATGAKWSTIEVTSQPPGVNGVLHNGPANSSITVTVPSNTKCTGGTDGATCLIRLNNGGPGTGSLANGAGPFGGCVAVSQANGATGTGNNTSGAANNASGSTATGNNRNGSNRNSGNRNAVKNSFYGRLVARHNELQDLQAKRELLDRSILEARQKLTAQLIDELKTTTGTAIDIPIDRMAGFDDAAATGGNSTKAQNNDAPLTQQEAVDLKKAVQLAIEQAIKLMASDEVDAGKFGQDSTITDKLNAEADAAQASGATSINAGNAGVGHFRTEVVDELLGGIKTATADLAATATATATGAAATSTAATGNGRGSNNASGGNATNSGNGRGSGRNRFGGNGRAVSNNRRRMQLLKRRIAEVEFAKEA